MQLNMRETEFECGIAVIDGIHKYASKISYNFDIGTCSVMETLSHFN